MGTIKTGARMLLVLVGSIVVGALLLCLVFLLPEDRIYKNLQKDGEVFRIEGAWPMMEGKTAKKLDDFTDAWMLENAFFDKEGAGALEKAMGVYAPWYGSDTPDQCLQRYVSGQDGYSVGHYARYWHGYLVLQKPFFMVTDYLGFRDLNMILQPILLLMAAFVIWRCLSPRYLLPFGASALFLRLDAVAFSLTFSSVFYITTISVLLIALCHKRLRIGDRYLYVFLLIGIVTNYLDLLTYPLVTLGVPLCLWVCLERERTCMDKLQKIVAFGICWSVGYAGMWVGKWIVASLVLHQNILADAWSQAALRSSASLGDPASSFSRIAVVVINFWVGFEGIVWPAVAGTILVCGIGLVQVKGSLKSFILGAIPFWAIGVMPVLWYMVMGNHSYVHTWFTYRALAVSVCAELSILSVGDRKETSKKTGGSYFKNLCSWISHILPV